ncbi:hypothetical protein [Bacillus sp. FJAT-42315]|uniref:hypothetical protein n=1 Tax=Bacillus sp. FJAT-42315 TaxID=2014077 RepID=UPI000BA936E3|nr:hypothetical protein [Bacillus sp. FJAT-42315]PAQ14352.1 hypothetical protein CD798_10800 [Bacillaceae bacterium SAOS 7]
MELKHLIIEINRSVDELDYVKARKYIEDNMEVLEGNRTSLKSNAREIMKFVKERVNSGIEPISRQELAIIQAVNTYANKFDLRGIKTVLRDKAKVFQREDIIDFLNSDAKTILESLGVIKKH